MPRVRPRSSRPRSRAWRGPRARHRAGRPAGRIVQAEPRAGGPSRVAGAGPPGPQSSAARAERHVSGGVQSRLGRVDDDDPVAARALGGVEPLVGAGQEHQPLRAVVRSDGAAQAGRDRRAEGQAVPLDRREVQAQPLEQRRRAARVHPGQDDEELLAAHPGGGTARGPGGRARPAAGPPAAAPRRRPRRAAGCR